MFDLQAALQQAESGDVALWEDIARHLLKAKTKPKKPSKRKQIGDYVYSLVTFKDRVTVLVGGYGLDPCGDEAKAKAERLRAGVMSGRWFMPGWLKMIPRTVSARAVTSDELEALRADCYAQRVTGWGKDAWSTTLEGSINHWGEPKNRAA